MQRYHFCEIDLAAIRHNVGVMKSHIAGGARFLAVVKADAYGHGAAPVAKAALEAGADMLAVAIPEEGIELREAGIAAPILVLGGIEESAAEAVVQNDLTQVVFDERRIRALAQAGQKLGRCAEVHLKLDTGMSRLGFSAEDIPALLERLRACPGLKPTLAVSHFPCADMPEKEDFTRRQLEKFTAMTDSLRAAYPALKRSLANSAGTMGWPESRFELCRPGFSLYGGNPFRGTAWEERGAGLEPVMEVSAPLLQVRHLKPGEGISYGQTFIAPREMSVAVVGAGYATGYPRGASGRIHVLVNGRRAPQVGRICMGMFMIDVTGLSARAGDLAWLLGGPAAPGETPVNIDELAEACGGFSYELLCLLGQGSPRVYHK